MTGGNTSIPSYCSVTDLVSGGRIRGQGQATKVRAVIIAPAFGVLLAAIPDRRSEENCEVDKQRALGLLKRQVSELEPLQYREVNPQLDRWWRDTRVVLEKVFSTDSGHVGEFNGISFSPLIYTLDEDRQLRLSTEGFNRGKLRASSFLESVISEVEQFWDSSEGLGTDPGDSLALVRNLCARFHLVVRQLRVRHDGRSTFDVEDEYDVQDLLHALLRLNFDDIRPEEWTPSYAGRSARMDFLLKEQKVVIETKRTRKGLGEKEIGDELLVDIARYKSHQDCRILVCFVYDPDGRISNPVGLAGDLSGEREGLLVDVIITPK